MTGTRVEIELVTSNQEMKVNRPLAEVFYQAMEQTNLPEYTEEELRFAESLTKKRDWSTMEIILEVWNRWKTNLFCWQSEPMSQKSVIPCQL